MFSSNSQKQLLRLLCSILARLQRLVIHLARRKAIVLRHTLLQTPHRRLQTVLKVLHLDSARVMLFLTTPSRPNIVLLVESRSRFFGAAGGQRFFRDLSRHRLVSDLLVRRLRSASKQRSDSTTIEFQTGSNAWPNELPAPKPKPWRIESKKPKPRPPRVKRWQRAYREQGQGLAWSELAEEQGPIACFAW